MTRREREQGFVTLQYVAATGFTLIFLVLLANLLVDLYTRAAVREALDEGVRAAVTVDAPAGACEQRANDALSGLVRGPARRDIAVTCAVGPQRVDAHATVVLHSWVPALVPPWRFTLHAGAHRET